MLSEGAPMPEFSLPDQNGRIFNSKDYIGKPLVIYFYPKDNTPGCTKEACSFRDSYGEYEKQGVAVVGISADSPASHEKFVQKFNLPFILLADTEKKVLKAFGAWGEKKLYGKVYEGIIRSTFVIGSDGTVKKVFPKVSPEGHASEVLAFV